MSLACLNGCKECTGCGACQSEPEEIGRCEACGEPIYANDDHYEIYGELIHEDCLSEWAEKFAKRCF